MSKRISEYVVYQPLNVGESKFLSSLKEEVDLCSFVFPDPSTLVGIEIEVEGLSKNNYLAIEDYYDLGNEDYKSLWRTEIDESLRGCSREYISFPVRNRLIEVSVKQLEHFLKTKHPYHQFSSRCSVHIHENHRHTTFDNLIKYLLTYLVLEPVFFLYSETYTSFNRKDNNFCIPLKDAKNALKLPYWIECFLKSNDINIIKAISGSWSKYTALNFKNLTVGDYPKGTIEFRHLGGTCNSNVILNWIKMIQNLRLFSKDINYEELKNRIFILNNNSMYGSFVQEVLKPSLALDYNSIISDIEDSVETVKELYAAVESMENIEKEYDKFRSTLFHRRMKLIYPKAVHEIDKEKLEEYITLVRACNYLRQKVEDIALDNPEYDTTNNQIVELSTKITMYERLYGFTKSMALESSNSFFGTTIHKKYSLLEYL